MAGSLRFPLKKCVCHGEKIPCGRRIFVRFYLYMPETINDCGVSKIASGLFGESQALPRQFCAHFTDTVENPGWFVSLFSRSSSVASPERTQIVSTPA